MWVAREWLVSLVLIFSNKMLVNAFNEFKSNSCLWEITIIRSDMKSTSKMKLTFNQMLIARG